MGALALRDEYFVPVEGFPNYEVSSLGRVINVKRGSDLTPTKDSKGYYKVALYRGSTRHDFGVHRLVAQAFFADFNENITVEHINHDKSENTVINLHLGKRLKLKVYIVNLKKEFESMMACAEFLGVETGQVHDYITGRRRHPKGWLFLVMDA